MSVASKIAALFDALTPADLEEMTPVARERFQALCGYWAEMAKPGPKAPRSGVLHDLRTRRRDE